MRQNLTYDAFIRPVLLNVTRQASRAFCYREKLYRIKWKVELLYFLAGKGFAGGIKKLKMNGGEKIMDGERLTVLEIIKEYLNKNGFDGLFYDNECGCVLDDFAPCGGDIFECRPGYKAPCDCGEGCDFHINMEKPNGN